MAQSIAAHHWHLLNGGDKKYHKIIVVTKLQLFNSLCSPQILKSLLRSTTLRVFELAPSTLPRA